VGALLIAEYVMPEFKTALAIGLVIGFILGYGVRAIISYLGERWPSRLVATA
jgi:uncharacterized membrane protein (Fun14 family)